MKIQVAVLLIGLVSLRAEVYQGTSLDDVIQGGVGNDLMMLGGGSDVGSGSSGDDVIFGEPGYDELHGDSGNDILVGGSASSLGDTAGNDLTGGEGNDLLLGGMFGDTYRYNIGDGLDRIREPGTLAGEIDKIVFGAGITTASLGFSRDKADLFVELGGGDILRIESWFGSSGGEFRIEEFQFDSEPTLLGSSLPFDGTTWTGTANADTYTAPGGANFWILGAGGNDWLTGAPGLDVMVGGDGNDALYGRDGADGLYGEAGSDTLNGENGDDSLYGGADNDTLTGGAGDDQLTGGTADDSLNGGPGNDNYGWSVGDGNDTIQDSVGEYDTSAVNRLVLGTGVLPSNVFIQTVAGNSTAIRFQVMDGSPNIGSVVINQWASNHSYTAVRHSKTWRIEFAIGTIWDGGMLATPLGDVLSGTAATDVVSGGDGGDSISGFDGNDTLSGDAGADTVYGGNGNDSLNGGADNDTLLGEAGDDLIDGAAGNDTIYGGTGADGMIGGTGDDALYGESGNDSYAWNSGDGNDTIQDSIGEYDTSAVNRLVFGTGVLPSNVVIQTVAGNSTAIRFQVMDGSSSIGSVVINRWASNHSYTAVRHSKTWRVEFANGTIWDGGMLATPLGDVLSGTAATDVVSGGEGGDSISGLDGNDTLSGDAGADTLNGGNGNDSLNGGTDSDTLNGDDGEDTLVGGDGNDTLVGGNGNDQMWGGLGNDSLNGGYGSDSYHWSPGDGNDTISESFWDLSTVNVLRINGLGVLGNLDFVRQAGNRLRVLIPQTPGGPAATIDIDNWALYNSGFRFLQFWDVDLVGWGTFRFANLPSTGNDIATGTSFPDLMLGGDGNDTLTGGDGSDYLHGGAGDDMLTSGNGNDLLFGSNGNDTLRGGEGNDLYFINLGGGSDRIEEPATQVANESNGIVFGEGIDASSVLVSRSGNDLVIQYQSGTESVTIAGWFGDLGRSSAAEFVRFHDGVQWGRPLVEALVGFDPSATGGLIDPAVLAAAIGNLAPSNAQSLEVLTPLW